MPPFLRELLSSSENWWIVPVGAALVLLGGMVTRALAPSGRSVQVGSALLLYLGSVASLLVSVLVPWPGAARYLLLTANLLFGLTAARVAFIVAFDGFLARRKAEPPRIARDIVQGMLFFLAALGALHSAGVEPGQLLTTSAVLTVVVGMALQETLGNLVAGLALQAERPFQLGDWVEIHPQSGQTGAIGRVREINWRATRLHTLDNVDLVVPNGQFSKAAFTNHDRPHGAPRRSIYFHCPLNVPPRDVHEAVLPSVAGAPGVLERPEPSLVTHGFDEVGVAYWLRYYIDDMGRRDAIDGGVRDRVWYALHRSGLALAVPGRSVVMRELTSDSEARDKVQALERRRHALRQSALFAKLPPAELDILANSASEAMYAANEVVIRQGDAGDKMYVVEEGALVIRVRGEQGETEVGRIEAGSFFGEMSLLTGDSRRATVVAVSPCRLLVVDHNSFHDLLDAHPEVAKLVSETVVLRRQGLDRAASTLGAGDNVEAETADLAVRIRRFFGFGG